MDIIEEAKKIGVSSGKSCPEDIDLLVRVLNKLEDNPTVVLLGAGEPFTLTVLSIKPDALFYSVDVDENKLWWEEAAIEYCGLENVNRHSKIMEGSKYAPIYGGPKVDLLIIDVDHTEKGILANLKAWQPNMNSEGSYIFCHDYDAQGAPHYYEGVEKACAKFFKKRFSWRAGWSAVWRVKGGTDR